MRCKAKMIDGSPVTFNSYDLGLQTYREEDDNILGIRHRVTEFVGEGFYVRSRVPSDYGPNLRRVRDEFALKRSGVDTATVEYWDENVTTSFGEYLGSGAWLGAWVPLFSPTPRDEPGTLTPGQLTYTWPSREPTNDMIYAGISAFNENFAQRVPSDVLMLRVWRAMEKARES